MTNNVNVRVEYQPRNDHVLVRAIGEKYMVEAVGPDALDLRTGDIVTLPDLSDDEGSQYVHPLDEEGALFLVREYLILAVEKITASANPRDVYEDFHS